MPFCPNCKALLLPKAGALTCPRCGTTQAAGGSQVIEHKAKSRATVVIDEETQKRQEIRSKTQAQCPKCFANEAYAELRQTRAADEAPTRFLECTKCGHRWREYS